MKKSSKFSLKKRSLDISFQHKNEASYKFSKKKKLLHFAEKRAGAERVNITILTCGYHIFLALLPTWTQYGSYLGMLTCKIIND